jgi:hypothetical protein
MLAAGLVVGLVATRGARADEGERSARVTTLDAIPADARARITKEAAGAPITKVEEEKTPEGDTVYEAHVKTKAGEIAITVDAGGDLFAKGPEKE